jgi:hypothetical protein
MLHCHLIVPDLILTAELMKEICAGLALPTLETLLGKGDTISQAVESYEAWLCAIHGVQKQQDWPLAPITLAADGGAVGTDFWLRADPVHLRVERGQLTLQGSNALDLSLGDACALTQALNAHFSGDKLVFQVVRPHHWYVCFAAAPQLRTVASAQAIGRNIDSLLPTGADGKRFVRLFNETQMVLFSHPLTEARETNGLPTVNSVWFWGGGKLPGSFTQAFAKIWASEEVACSLGQVSGTPIEALPETGAAWLSSATTASHCGLMLDQLRTCRQQGDLYRWREALQRLESEWCVPLLNALKAGKIKRLTLTAFGENQMYEVSMQRRTLWQFWRHARPLAALAED